MRPQAQHLFSKKKGWHTIAIVLPLLSLIISLSCISRGWAGAAPGSVAVTTYHNDLGRTGQNSQETHLTTSNVNAQQFGKRVEYPVDGYVWGQPLYVPHVLIGGSYHNVVYVTTSNDSVYAFDADQRSAVAPLWQTNFLHWPVITSVPWGDVDPEYANLNPMPQIGIIGTPVIDLSTGILYVDAMTKEHGHNYVHHLHALNITTGREMPGSPVAIEATVPGNGYDNYNGTISFYAMRQIQRTALLLLNGVVYICWASFGDIDPYHGWVMGYTYSSAGLQQVSVYASTANGSEGGIWMGAAAPAADSNGNIFLGVGNGTFDLASGGVDSGSSVLKLNPNNGLSVSDYFAPFNQVCLSNMDLDLGSSVPMLIPDQTNTNIPRLLIEVGKEGRLYVINRDNMGKFTNDPNLNCNTSESQQTTIDHVVQEFPPHFIGPIFGAPAYWRGTPISGQFVYTSGIADQLKAFHIANGLLSTTPTSQTPETFGYPGVTPSISSNGNTPGTGIIWVNDPSSCNTPGCQPGGPAALRAYDASNLNVELYNSEQNPTRDRLTGYSKFSAPTIADGKVFVSTPSSVAIYGLLNQ
jgi:hypothetical protein